MIITEILGVHILPSGFHSSAKLFGIIAVIITEILSVPILPSGFHSSAKFFGIIAVIITECPGAHDDNQGCVWKWHKIKRMRAHGRTLTVKAVCGSITSLSECVCTGTR